MHSPGQLALSFALPAGCKAVHAKHSLQVTCALEEGDRFRLDCVEGKAGCQGLGGSFRATPWHGMLSETLVSLPWTQSPCDQIGYEGEWHSGSQPRSDVGHVGMEGDRCLVEICT